MSDERRRELEEQLLGMAYRLTKISKELKLSVHMDAGYFEGFSGGHSKAEIYMFDEESNIVARARELDGVIGMIGGNDNE